MTTANKPVPATPRDQMVHDSSDDSAFGARLKRQERILRILACVMALAVTAAAVVFCLTGLAGTTATSWVPSKVNLLGLVLLAGPSCGCLVLAAGAIRALRERLRRTEHEAAQVRALLEGERWLTDALRASEGNVRSLLHASVDGIVLTDEDGIVKYFNPAAAVLFGEEGEHFLGPSPALVRAAERAEEITIRRPGGGTTTAEMRVIRTTWDGKDAYLATVRDITTRKQAEVALLDANEKLRQLDQAKSDFVSMVSHELRTPLTAIRNAVHIMLSGKAGAHTETHERFLQMALRNIDRLTGILNEVLSMAKLESGKMEICFADTEIAPLIENVVATFSPEADATSIEFRAVLPDELPTVYADAGRVEQVLCNLVSNALKFTPRGGRVTISSRRDGDLMVVEVADTGIGIAPEDQKRVFEPFYQAGGLMTRSSKGTGLGTTIAREIVEAHGGRVWFESSPGKGTRFFFTLPIRTERSVEMSAFEGCFRRNRDRECISVLVVEVHGASGEVLNDHLQRVKVLIEKRLRKTTDMVVMQPGCGRVLVVLPETPKTGAAELKKDLLTILDEPAFAVDIAGPATYPEDGMTGRELIEFTISDDGRQRRAYG